MLNARQNHSSTDSDSHPPSSSTYSNASDDTMTSTSVATRTLDPDRARSPSTAPSPLPSPPKSSTHMASYTTIARGKAPPPPIITSTSALRAWPLGTRRPSNDSSRDLWNIAARSPRPRTNTSNSSETGRTLLGAGLFRTKSAESSQPEFGQEALHRSQTDPLPPLTPADIIVPSSARDHNIEDPSSLPATPRLRTSDSVPDHRKMRYVHPELGKSRPRLHTGVAALGGLPSPAFAGHSPGRLSPALPLSPGPQYFDRFGNRARESVKSTYTTASSRADLSSVERSSTTTSMTSASDHWNISSSQFNSRIMQDDISVEDYISLYAEGFEDDPPHDMSKLSPTKSPGSPWPAFGWDNDAPPVPKINLASAKLQVPPTQSRIEDSPKTDLRTPAHLPSPASQPPPPAPSSAPEDAVETASQRSRSSYNSNQSKSIYPSDEQSERTRSTYVEPEPDPNSDRYGFKKDTRYITLDQYEVWSVRYEDFLQRRRTKWEELMKQHRLSIDHPVEFPPRSDKVKRFIRKGVPPEWRGAVWFWYAGGPSRLAQNRGLYDQLMYQIEQKGHLGEADREHIERDLNRTFPDNDKFKRCTLQDPQPRTRPSSAEGAGATSQEEPPERPMIQSLRRVLQCFAVHQPKIGYCQSLNFLAGKLLLFLDGDEEKAFHLLCILTSEHLPGTHGVALEGANVDISVLMTTLKDQMPALWAKLEDHSGETPTSPRSPMLGKGAIPARLPTVSLATTSWFMSCFVGTLPTETCCRVWDVLFYEGSKTLFRVALGIFKLGAQEIMSVTDPMEVFQIVQTMPRKMLDSNALMEVSFGKGMEGRGLLSQDTVKRRREERREVYQRERATASSPLTRTPSTPSIPDSASMVEDAEEIKRPMSRGASLKKLGRLKSFSRKKAPPVPQVPV